jgi:hypothetical protein
MGLRPQHHPRAQSSIEHPPRNFATVPSIIFADLTAKGVSLSSHPATHDDLLAMLGVPGVVHPSDVGLVITLVGGCTTEIGRTWLWARARLLAARWSPSSPGRSSRFPESVVSIIATHDKPPESEGPRLGAGGHWEESWARRATRTPTPQVLHQISDQNTAAGPSSRNSQAPAWTHEPENYAGLTFLARHCYYGHYAGAARDEAMMDHEEE